MVVVPFGEAGAVTDYVFRETVAGVEEAGDGHESTGAADDFAGDHFGVTRTKGMKHATAGDGAADDRRERGESGGIFIPGAGEQFVGACKVGVGERRHSLVYALKNPRRKEENRGG